MTPEEKKNSLANRINRSVTKEFVTDAGTKQRRKKCTTCGNGYLSVGSSSTCSDNCRQKKSRK